ncbi:restriction endonuclease subunit S [bacterium]|nr:restriction endonuclease subunit S [bacterium]
MIPKGWKKQLLSSLAEVRTGIAKGKTNLKDSVVLPYLRVANVQDGHIDLTEVKTISVESSQIERYSLRPGDVLMTEGGDFDKLGRGDVWKGQINPCLHQNHIFCVRPNELDLDSVFLAQLAGSNYGKSYFLSCAKRTTNLASINSTQLKQFPILLPPLFEQIKIVEILSTWDEAIETVEKLIENAQLQKRALMHVLMKRKKRFPGFHGRWLVCKFEDLVSQISGGGTPERGKADYWNGTIPWITVKDLNFRKIEKSQEYITDQGLENCAGRLIPPNTVLMATRMAVGRCSITKIPVAINQDLKAIFPKPNFSHEYLFNWLSANEREISKLAGGSTVKGLTLPDLRKLEISIPSELSEQEKINQLIDCAESQEANFRKLLLKLKQEKSALMQQLLTGKRRVKLDSPEPALAKK